MTTKIIASKAFNSAAITVNLTSSELSVSISANDFVAMLAKESVQGIAEIVADCAGNPALLLTSAQLKAKLTSTISSDAVSELMLAKSTTLIESLKAHSVMAE